jgi:hypothetical protein
MLSASQGAKVGSSKPGLRIKLVGCCLTDVVVVGASSVDVSTEAAAEVAAEVAETEDSYVVVLSAIVVSEEAKADDSVSLAEDGDGTPLDVADSVSAERILEDKPVKVADSVVNEVVENISVLVASALPKLEMPVDVIELEVWEEGLHGEAEVSSHSAKS